MHFEVYEGFLMSAELVRADLVGGGVSFVGGGIDGGVKGWG